MLRGLFLWGFLCFFLPTTVQATDCHVEADEALTAFNQKHKDARDRLASGIDSGCDEPLLYLYLGAFYRQHNDLNAAIAALERGVKRYPDHQSLGLDLAIALAFQGRLQEALTRYNVLLQKDRTAVPVLLGKARLLIWMEQAKESLPLYQEVLTREPRNLEARRGMGAAYLSLLKRKAAEQQFRDVLREQPHDEESLSALQMLKEIHLVEGTLTGGISGSSANGISPIAGVRATLKVTPRLQLGIGYQFDAPFLFGDTAQSSGYRQRAEAAAVVRVGTRVDLSLGYQFAALQTMLRHSLPIELSIKLPRSLQLLSSIRPALDHQLNLSLLWSIGLQYHFATELWIMLQGFRYDDRLDEHATVGVATIHLPIGKRCQLKLGGVYGYYRQGHSYGGFAESVFRLHTRADLGLFYQYAAGFLQQHTATLSLRWRY